MRFLKMFALAALLTGVPFLAKGIEMKDGDQIAILSGQNFEIHSWSISGYMRLLNNELARAGIRKSPWIFLESKKTEQMRECLDNDVIAKKPFYVLIIPGAADYNPWSEKTVSESFTKNLAEIIRKLKAANIKTAIATSYAVNSTLPLSLNQNVAAHNDAIRALAKEQGLQLIDFAKVVDDEKKIVRFDGSPAAKCLVNQMFAAEVLRLIGFSDKEVSACREAWLDMPGAIRFMPSVSVNTYEKLKAAAKASGKDVGIHMSEVLRNSMKHGD